MKVKFGAIVTDGRGKIGGHVMSKNRGGAYMRTKVTPSNPRTTAQQLNRALLGSLSASWSSLGDAFRATWNAAVNDWTKTNIFGDSIKPTGKNLYVALNKNVNAIGGQTMDTAPAKVEMPILALESVTLSISQEQITPNFEGDLGSAQVVISATGPLSAGTSFTKGKYRKIYNAPASQLDNSAIYDAYVARFGQPGPSQNIYFEVKIVEANGQMSVPETTQVTYLS
jgi:hypothetical protein